MVEISALQKEIEGVAVLDIPEFRVLKMGVEEILNQVGLADHGDMPADKLPLGLARRLAFGRAILHNPKAMILVEIF